MVCSSQISSNEPQFFKILMGDFKKQLMIPPKFMKHIAKGASQSVILQGPNGSSWKVKLSKTKTRNFLSDGWSNFVQDHSLKEHEFLVFKYDGNMHFSIKVFDKTACEREDLFEAKTPKNCTFEGKNGEDHPRKCIFQQSSKSELPKPRSVIKIESTNSDGHDLPKSTTDSKIRSKHVHLPLYEPQAHTYFVSKRRHVSRGEKAYARRVANSFRSPFPYTVIRMQEYHASKIHDLIFPSQFAQMHLPQVRTELVLNDPNGLVWTVAYIASKEKLCKGWLSFVRGNRIEEWDFCAFELVGKVELRVHIFRVLEDTILVPRLRLL